MKKLLLCLVLLANVAHARIIGGVVSVGTETNGIFAIATLEKDKSSLCTATKIAHNLILTAAHCVDSADMDKTLLGFSTAMKVGPTNYLGLPVKQIILHPSFHDSKTNYDDHDIALVVVTPTAEFKALNIVQIDFNEVVPGATIQFWGYGCQTTTNVTAAFDPEKKYGITQAQSKSILEGSFGDITASVHEDAENISSNYLLTSSRPSLCLGDSGGPALLNNKIVGVNASFLAKDARPSGASRSGIGYVNLHTRISAVSAWIMENAFIAATL